MINKTFLSKLLYPYWALCFLLTHLPPSSVPLAVSSFDKIAHGLGYFILGVFLFKNIKDLKKACLILLVYSFIDEITQPLIGRSFEVVDLLADNLGGFLGVMVSSRIFPGGLGDQSK